MSRVETTASNSFELKAFIKTCVVVLTLFAAVAMPGLRRDLLHRVDPTWCLTVNDDTYVQLYESDRPYSQPIKAAELASRLAYELKRPNDRFDTRIEHQNVCASIASVFGSDGASATVRVEWLPKQGHFVGTATEVWRAGEAKQTKSFTVRVVE